MNKAITLVCKSLAFSLCLTLSPATVQASSSAVSKTAQASASAVSETGVNKLGEAFIRTADPSTMDTYTDALLNDEEGSRNAGRVWADKTVFAYNAAEKDGGLPDNILKLDNETDGYKGNVGFEADFLNVFSALGSSQVVNDHTTSPFDLVLVLDMSGSMAQSTQYPINAGREYGYQETMKERIKQSRVQKTLDAVNETIDSVMEENSQNRVAVCVYGANAAVLMPLAHYQRVDGQPYLTIGGMETLYDRDDYSTPQEMGQTTLQPDEGIWTINRDACYTVVANALYDQSEVAPETYEAVWNRTISNNVKNDVLHPDPDVDGDGRQLQADQYVGYMTNTQGGIYLGMKQLADTEEMVYTETFENGETNRVARVPVLMVLTDGGANFAFNNPNEDAQHELPVNAGNEWYDIYLPQDNITTLYNDGVARSMLTSIPAYDDGGIFYDSDADVGGTPSTILEVLMTASYMKNVVEKHYEQGWEKGRAELDSRIPLSIYTVSVDAVHLPAWGRYRIYPTMDPEVYFHATLWDDPHYACIGDDFRAPLAWKDRDDNQMEDLLPYTYGKWEEWKNASTIGGTVSVLADWVGNSNSKGPLSEQLDINPEHTVIGCATLRIGSQTEGYTYVRRDGTGNAVETIGVTNQEVIDNINYPDRFYDVESEELSSVFREIVDMLRGKIFVPIAGRNNAAAGNSVTYHDPIGQYMQVKNGSVRTKASGKTSEESYDMAALLFGQMHGLERAAVYDPDFYSAYMRKFTSGAKSGFTRETAAEFPEGWYRGDNGATAEYLSPENAPEDPWNNGWVYRIRSDTLYDYLPTLGTGLLEEQSRKTYTLYRFSDNAEERDILRMNPAYGTAVPTNLENMWEDLEEKPADNDLYSGEHGVYRLNDIRIWTEVSSSSASGQSALYVNIPAAALPTQTALITLSADGKTSFEGNRNKKSESTPFRLFYAVGLDEDLLNQDLYSRQTGVDIDSLPQNYRKDHQGDGVGSVFFHSGSYSNDARKGYEGVRQTVSAEAGSEAVSDSVLAENETSAEGVAGDKAAENEATEAETAGDGTSEDEETENEAAENEESAGTLLSYGGSGDRLLGSAGLLFSPILMENSFLRQVSSSSIGSAGKGYSGTDANVTFSPSEENSYYLHQEARPLYKHAYRVTETKPTSGTGVSCIDNTRGWTAVNQNQSNSATTWEDGSTGGVTWTGGEYMGTYTDEAAYTAAREAAAGGMITDSLGNQYHFAEGGIIFFERDLLTSESITEQNEKTGIQSGDYYFFFEEYYLPGTGTDQEGSVGWRAACSTGSEFAVDNALEDVGAGKVICWADLSGSTDTVSAYMAENDVTHGFPTVEKLTYDEASLREYLTAIGITEDELERQVLYWLNIQNQVLYALDIDLDGRISADEYASSGIKWVLAARPESTRAGEFYKTGKEKGANPTLTARDSFTPATGTEMDAENGFVIIDYLGNNGKLTVSNSLLCIVNSVSAPQELAGTEFRYQIYAEGLTGEQEAVVLRYDPSDNGGKGGWRRQIGAVSVETDGSGFLLDENGEPAVVDKNGQPAGLTASSGDQRYYVYAAPDGISEGRKYLFISEESKDYDPGRPLSDMGRRVYAAGSLPENSVAQEDFWTTYHPAGQDNPAGTMEFYARDVWLVPAGRAGKAAFEPDSTEDYIHIGFADGTYKEDAEPFVIARLEPDDTDTSMNVVSDYLVDVTYLTETLSFGKQSGEAGAQGSAMISDALMDTTPFWLTDTTCAAIPGQQRAVMQTAEYARLEESGEEITWVTWDEVASHTAEFTLSGGEGLLLSIRSGSGYRVTEEGLSSEGFLLKEINQDGSAEEIHYAINDMSTPSGSAVISAWRRIYDGEESLHRDCGEFPNGPDEYEGQEAIRHWVVSDNLQMDNSSMEQMAQLPKARFLKAGNGRRIYNCYGTAGSGEEFIRYINEYAPASLVISNWLEPAGENVSLTRENVEQEFEFTLTLEGIAGLNINSDLPYSITGVKDGKTVTIRSGTLLSRGEKQETEDDIKASHTGVWRFTLKCGQQITVGGLSGHVSYTVTQKPVSGYLIRAVPDGTSDKNQNVTVKGKIDTDDLTPEVVTYTNRKTAYTNQQTSGGINLVLWIILAAGVIANIVIFILFLVKRRREKASKS